MLELVIVALQCGPLHSLHMSCKYEHLLLQMGVSTLAEEGTVLVSLVE